MNDALIATSYGAWVLIVLVAALASGRVSLIRTGMVLLLAWAVCNVIVNLNGYPNAPLLIPAADAVFAVLAASVAVLERSKTAAVVFGLYIAAALLHVAAFATNTQGTYFYFSAHNGIFILQTLAVGGTGAWCCVLDWRARSPVQPRNRARVS